MRPRLSSALEFSLDAYCSPLVGQANIRRLDVNTKQYQNVTADLAKAGEEVHQTIADIQHIADTIAAVTKIVGYAGQLLALV